MKTMHLSNYCFLLFLIVVSCGKEQKNDTETTQKDFTKPNIIYIMADDLGYGDLGIYGQSKFKTPNIDALGTQGIKFTDHYAGTSVCAPSRAVLMTGLHMGNVPIRGNRQYAPHGQVPLPNKAVTVAELAKKAGYVTGMIGKWGLGIVGSEGAPSNQGWDFFFGYTDQVLAHNYFPEYLVKNDERVYLENEVKYLDSTAWHKGYGSYSTVKKEYSNDLFTTEALGFIERHQQEPFFLYLPYTIPHNNGEAPTGSKQEVPTYGRFDSLSWDSEEKGYAAMIERLDGYVGQIVQHLNELGLSENTLVIFTSDNGPMQEERHTHTAFFDSNGPLRGGKRDLYEGGIRVPFLAKWPAQIAAGSITDHPSAFYDFLPTACEAMGIATPDYIDGISYLPALQGKSQPKHAFLYWEFYGQGGKQAVRKGKWKAVRNSVNINPNAAWELYDLSKDLSESENLARSQPEVVAELDQLARQAHTADPEWPFGAEVGK